MLNISDIDTYYKSVQETISQLPVKAMNEYAKEIKTASERIREAIAYNPVLRSQQPKKTATLRSKQKKK